MTISCVCQVAIFAYAIFSLAEVSGLIDMICDGVNEGPRKIACKIDGKLAAIRRSCTPSVDVRNAEYRRQVIILAQEWIPLRIGTCDMRRERVVRVGRNLLSVWRRTCSVGGRTGVTRSLLGTEVFPSLCISIYPVRWGTNPTFACLLLAVFLVYSAVCRTATAARTSFRFCCSFLLVCGSAHCRVCFGRLPTDLLLLLRICVAIQRHQRVTDHSPSLLAISWTALQSAGSLLFWLVFSWW